MTACFLKYPASDYIKCSSVSLARLKFRYAVLNKHASTATIHLAVDSVVAYRLSLGLMGGPLCKKELT